MVLLGDDMKNGFTLIEILAVILLIGLLAVFTVPTVVNQVSKRSEEIDEISKKVIYSATDLYVKDQELIFDKTNLPYCLITLQTLIDNGYLDKNSAKYASGTEIPTNQIIKITKDSYNQNQYQLVQSCR